MERTSTKKKEELILLKNPILIWKKIGGGSFHWNDQIIKPGQIFDARREDLPEAFMDMLELQNPEEEAKMVSVESSPEKLWKLQKLEDDTYNVINNIGKAINESPMTRLEAKDLITSLTE